MTIEIPWMNLVSGFINDLLSIIQSFHTLQCMYNQSTGYIAHQSGYAYLGFLSASDFFLSSSPKLPNNRTVLFDMESYVSRFALKINILYFLRSVGVFERNSEECNPMTLVVNCMWKVMAYSVHVYSVF